MAFKEQLKKASGITLNDADLAEVAQESRGGHNPRTSPGQTMQLQAMYRDAEQTIDGLQKQLTGYSFEIPVDELQETGGRRRSLSKEQFQELVENLRHNTLVNPIVVRNVGEGKYEIISGNNRVAAYRELGRSKIKATLLDSGDDEADIHAFYANLIQPNLPDYEKYLGFKMLMGKHPDLKPADVAKRVGVSERLIRFIMAFDGLPAEAVALVSQQPGILGAKAAEDLAKLAQQGRGEQVNEVIRELAAGKIDQARAVQLARTTNKPAVAKPDVTAVTIKSGKTNYCKIQRAASVVRIQFNDDEEAQVVQQMIQVALENRAKEKAS